MPRNNKHHAYRNDDMHAIPCAMLAGIVIALLIIAGMIAIQEVNFWFGALHAALRSAS